MKVHVVKAHADFFEEVWAGRKPFEIRRDDRGYKFGDVMIQREVENPTVGQAVGAFTGRTMVHQVGYLTNFEQRPSMVVFALEEIARWEKDAPHQVPPPLMPDPDLEAL